MRLSCHLVVFFFSFLFFSLFPIEALQEAILAFEIISSSFVCFFLLLLGFLFLFIHFYFLRKLSGQEVASDFYIFVVFH